jgi:arsenite methyltransferase
MASLTGTAPVTDVYATITEADAAVLESLATAMEVSAADEQHRDMVARYLSDLDLQQGPEALEIGCGTGAIARTLAARHGIRTVVGVDPSPGLIERARILADGIDNLAFREGDGRRLAFPDASFDLVVAHRVLSHVPAPQLVLEQAFRVLRPGGALAVFDGDYATITVALGDPDPLQT